MESGILHTGGETLVAVVGIVLQISVPVWLEETVSEIVAYLPRIVGAFVVLFIGWWLAGLFGRIVARLTDRIELDRLVVGTPIGRMLGGSERAASEAFGTLTRWFVYAITLVAVTDILAVPLFSEWMSTAVSYIPAFLAGLLVIVFGFIVADFIGDAIMGTRAATETEYTRWFANGTRMFLYFTAVVIGLDTMGIDVQILYVFAQAVAWGVAAAIALGVGIAFGWGGKDYVSANIDSWLGRAGAGSGMTTPPATNGGAESDGGADAEVETDEGDDEGDAE